METRELMRAMTVRQPLKSPGSGGRTFGFERILLPVDGRSTTARAVAAVLKAAGNEAEILVFAAVESDLYPDGLLSAEVVDSVVRYLAETGLRARGEVAANPGLDVSTRIVEAATRFGPDLVVVGSSPHRPLTSVFRANIASHLVGLVKCPVLVA